MIDLLAICPAKDEDGVGKGNRWRYPGFNLAGKAYPVDLVEKQRFLSGSLWLPSHYLALLVHKLCSNIWLSLYAQVMCQQLQCLKDWEATPSDVFEGRVYSFVSILVTLSSFLRSCHKWSAGSHSVRSDSHPPPKGHQVWTVSSLHNHGELNFMDVLWWWPKDT